MEKDYFATEEKRRHTIVPDNMNKNRSNEMTSWFGSPKEDWHKFNEDWWIDVRGDMYQVREEYDIVADRLDEGDWIRHLMTKAWFDANTFLPAYFEACKRAGISKVTIDVIR